MTRDIAIPKIHPEYRVELVTADEYLGNGDRPALKISCSSRHGRSSIVIPLYSTGGLRNIVWNGVRYTRPTLEEVKKARLRDGRTRECREMLNRLMKGEA